MLDKVDQTVNPKEKCGLGIGSLKSFILVLLQNGSGAFLLIGV